MYILYLQDRAQPPPRRPRLPECPGIEVGNCVGAIILEQLLGDRSFAKKQ